eukprot:7837209-Karenia_brevis.AAC.1
MDCFHPEWLDCLTGRGLRNSFKSMVLVKYALDESGVGLWYGGDPVDTDEDGGDGDIGGGTPSGGGSRDGGDGADVASSEDGGSGGHGDGYMGNGGNGANRNYDVIAGTGHGDDVPNNCLGEAFRAL